MDTDSSLRSHIVTAVVVPLRLPDLSSSMMKGWRDSQTN
jgi:hypothetical protein